MKIQRIALEYLQKWRTSNGRKPLIIRGARQVGKTTLVKQFSSQYEQSIILNMEKQKDTAPFERLRSVYEIVDSLFLLNNLSIDKLSETLLFIDEIQESPHAIAQLRYFYEEIPELHVIAAGSLLEHAMGSFKSFPVGRVQYLYLFPFNFQEFLQAFEQYELLERLHEIPLSESTHYITLELFHKYGLLGGMPEVVVSSAQGKSVTSLQSIYESIWNTYVDDVVKYARNTTEEKVIKHIIRTAPFYLDQRISFEKFGRSNYRSREVGESFRSLDDARVIQLIYPTTSFEPPAVPDIRKRPRLQFLDTGILNHALGIQAELIGIEDLSSAFKGALLPHLITQELISLNIYSYRKPNFWVREKKTSQAEVDLIYQKDNMLIPIEIKSGKTGRLRSLHQFIESSPHPYAVRIYGGPFHIQKTKTPAGTPYILMNLPYYLGTYNDQYIEYMLSKD
jgi:hypothetical protein